MTYLHPFLKPISHQYLISIITIATGAVLCYIAHDMIGYREVALILLMIVSVLAMLLQLLPVLLAAVLSIFVWNFFFIPPLYTFSISSPQDWLLFFMYFFIVLVHAVLSNQLRRVENKIRDREEKEKTIRLYNTFLHSLSHELRTPIATIVGAVDLLKYQDRSLNNHASSLLLDEIGDAGWRLNRQVDNMLNMGRLESGVLKPKQDWCDIHEIANAIIQKIKQTASQTIIYHADKQLPLVKTDVSFFEQILFNLVLNATQYTPSDSIIQVGIRYEDGHCIVTVRDNGPGFPADQFSLVFEKFYRIPHSKAGGTGLGLSIVKGFTEALQGNVSIHNADGSGVIFTVIIPAEASYLNNLKNE